MTGPSAPQIVERMLVDESLQPRLSNRLCQPSLQKAGLVTRRSAAIALNDIGTKLFISGHHADALVMYNSAVQALRPSVSTYDPNDEIPVLAAQRVAWGELKLNECSTKSCFSFQDHPIDTYQEGECDVGPRPFRCPISVDSSEVESIHTRYLEATVMYNWALVHHSKSQLQEATETYAMAVYLISSLPRTMGDNFPVDIDQVSKLGMQVQNNLGQIKYVEGKEMEALDHFFAAIEWSNQVKDSSTRQEHVLATAQVMSNFCRTKWMTMNTSDEAYNYFVKLLSLRSSVLDWDHLDVASSHYNLGIMNFVRGSYEQANYHLEQYIKINNERRKKGEQQVDVIPALVYILLIKNDNPQDDQSTELVLCLRLLLDKREEYGTVHSEVATILNYIGALLFQRKELDYAIEFYHEELRVEQHLLGCNKKQDATLSLAVTMNNIGRILQEQGKYEKAKHFYLKALETECRTSKCGAELVASIASGKPPSVIQEDDDSGSLSTANLFATIWYNLGLIHDLTNAPKDAIWAFKMSLELRRALLGPNHADVACLWYNIGTLQMENDMLSEASASLRESLRIRRLGVCSEQNDTHILSTLQKLATLHQNRGSVTEAIEAHSQVLEVQRTSNSNSMDVGVTLRSIAELQHATGDLDGALDTADQSLHTLLWCPAMHHVGSADYLACAEHIGSVLLSIGSLYHERCDPNQATAAFQEAGRIIGLARDSVKTGNPPTTLMPLLDLCKMLASSHCAAEA